MTPVSVSSTSGWVSEGVGVGWGGVALTRMSVSSTSGWVSEGVGVGWVGGVGH